MLFMCANKAMSGYLRRHTCVFAKRKVEFYLSYSIRQVYTCKISLVEHLRTLQLVTIMFYECGSVLLEVYFCDNNEGNINKHNKTERCRLCCKQQLVYFVGRIVQTSSSIKTSPNIQLNILDVKMVEKELLNWKKVKIIHFTETRCNKCYEWKRWCSLAYLSPNLISAHVRKVTNWSLV